MDLYFQSLLLAVEIIVLTLLRRGQWRAAQVAAVLGSIAALALMRMLAADIFHLLRMAAWGVFLHVPLSLFVATIAIRTLSTRARTLMVGVSLAILAIAFDAFLVEPTSIETTNYSVASTKIASKLRIVVVSDIQTDHVGEYEREVLQMALELDPDLILLPGDFVQTHRRNLGLEQLRLNKILLELGFTAPLGAIAVNGNVDPRNWGDAFSNSGITALDRSGGQLIREDVYLTGLMLDDSFDGSIQVPAVPDKFHIVFGHAPDFALGDVNADLLVAGHTHGGQVRLPWLGPLITLSRVPRSWADGITRLDDSRVLVVSRGIGHERGLAPRLRFLCRPELVVIEITPMAG